MSITILAIGIRIVEVVNLRTNNTMAKRRTKLIYKNTTQNTRLSNRKPINKPGLNSGAPER